MLTEIESDAVDRGYRRLPPKAAEILCAVEAPPRLIAHHILVHDAASQLIDGLRPMLARVDEAAICFGAATHDIGKTVRPSELSEPGKTHEEAGQNLLLEHNVSPSHARFAVTHGLSVDAETLNTEDLVVALADKCWKGKRVNRLEERLARELASTNGLEFFDVLLKLSDLTEAIAEQASHRLSWQNKHSA